MKSSFLFGSLSLLLSATRFDVALSACMHNDGTGTKPLTSVYRFATFEDTAEAIYQTANASIAQANATLTELLTTLDQTVTLQEQQLDAAVTAPRPLTYDDTLGAINRMLYEFWQPGYRLHLLSSTSDKEEMRNAGTDAVVQMSKWSRDNVEYNLQLYQIIAAFSVTDEAKKLKGEKLRYLTETMEDYERKGMALSAADREQLVSWEEELDLLTTDIGTTITNDQGAVSFEFTELAGLPEQQLATLQYNETSAKYTAQTAIASQYRAVATYAEDPATRLKTLRAANQRAMQANGEPILEVVALRQQIANLLGFEHWADYRISDKMAKKGQTALDFIQNIDNRLDDKFFQEKEMLLDLKREHLEDPTITELNRWDLSYYMNILMEREYQINQEEISEYFEEEATLRGIFDLYEELFNIQITMDPDGPPGGAWADDDIKFVHISETAEAGGAPIGGVYLDLHPRTGKFTHFAKFALVKGHHITNETTGETTYQAPHCAIIGNWPRPVGNNTVSLWRFSNVNTMFHEFGHALHEVLTCTEISSFAGTAVARDFVEVPSQMLERWLDDINVIRRFAKHYQTGNAMPESLLQSLIAAKTATVGHGYKGQVALGLADFTIHTYSSPDEVPETYQDIYDATNADFSAYYTVPEGTAKLASFGHLFGGYDAGYYGYAWADAIAADLASRFRSSEQGFMDAEIGAAFRKEILEVGGSRDPAESVRAFLGRDWNTDAFFEEMGLESTTTAGASSGTAKSSFGMLFSSLLSLGVAAIAALWLE